MAVRMRVTSLKAEVVAAFTETREDLSHSFDVLANRSRAGKLRWFCHHTDTHEVADEAGRSRNFWADEVLTDDDPMVFELEHQLLRIWCFHPPKALSR